MTESTTVFARVFEYFRNRTEREAEGGDKGVITKEFFEERVFLYATCEAFSVNFNKILAEKDANMKKKRKRSFKNIKKKQRGDMDRTSHATLHLLRPPLFLFMPCHDSFAAAILLRPM